MPFVDLASTAVTYIVIPWCVFVTASLFNQRQEIALLKQAFYEFKESIRVFNDHCDKGEKVYGPENN